MKQVVGFIAFMIGALIMCAYGRNLVLTGAETMFILGVVITTGTGLYLANERGSDERGNDERNERKAA